MGRFEGDGLMVDPVLDGGRGLLTRRFPRENAAQIVGGGVGAIPAVRRVLGTREGDLVEPQDVEHGVLAENHEGRRAWTARAVARGTRLVVTASRWRRREVVAMLVDSSKC